jgi:putative transposase
MQQGIEFFTATCLNWQNILLAEERKQIVLDSLAYLVTNKRIWLYGYVIMPNHVHILWCKQPEWLDKNVQQHFAKFTGQQFKFSLINNGEDLSTYKSTQNDREYQFWERRLTKRPCTTGLYWNKSCTIFIITPLKQAYVCYPRSIGIRRLGTTF